MVMVRRFVLLVIFSVAFCARAWAANPDCDRFNRGSSDHFLESTFNARMSQAIGCNPPPDWQMEKPQLLSLRYLLDLPGGEESQILSAYYVVQSLKHERIQDATLEYAFSGYDARRLDAKKLEAEITARKLSPESATNARALFKQAQERNAWMIDGLGKMTNANYDYKKLFIEVPEAAAVAWHKFYQEHKDVYDLGTSIERQLSESPGGNRGFEVVDVKGCGDMHKTFKQYLASTQKGKLPPEIEQFLQADALGFEMLSALAECDALTAFRPAPLPGSASIALGAVVEIEDEDTGEGRTFFLAPVGAGVTLTGPGGDGHLSVVTPVSPIGRAVLGRRTGDVVDVTVDGEPREWQITYVG